MTEAGYECVLLSKRKNGHPLIAIYLTHSGKFHFLHGSWPKRRRNGRRSKNDVNCCVCRRVFGENAAANRLSEPANGVIGIAIEQLALSGDGIISRV